MTTALLITAGSRGDVEPFIALLTPLLSTPTFTKLYIFTQPDYHHLIPNDPRITILTLPFSVATFNKIYLPQYLKAQLRSLFTRAPFDIVAFQRTCISLMISRIILPCMPSMCEVADEVQPSLIVASSLAANLAAALADRMRVPAAIFNLQPNSPTGAYPNYASSISNAKLAASEIAALLAHPNRSPKEEAAYRATFRSSFHASSICEVNDFRRKVGLPTLTTEQHEDLFAGRYNDVHIINSYPKQLVPPGHDWSSKAHQVPSLADDYLPPAWDAGKQCPGLVKYLEQGGKPFVVSFGSMNATGHEASVSRAVLKGLRDAGVERVVILKGSSNIGCHHLVKRDELQAPSVLSRIISFGLSLVKGALNQIGLGALIGNRTYDEALLAEDEELREWASGHVHHCAERVQFSWLLPQCVGLMCHGGAGTLVAGLRAGIPVIVSPILCDQFMWGQLISELGIGAVAGPMLTEMNNVAVEEAVKVAMGEEVRRNVAVFGEVLRSQGRGSEIAARLLESFVETGA